MLAAVGGPADALRRVAAAAGETVADLDDRFVVSVPPGAGVHVGERVACVLLDADDEAAAAVALAYAARGLGALAEPRTRFAALVWDRTRREAVAVVDRLATRPLFYARSGAGVLVADAVAPILRFLPTRPRPDLGAAAAWLLGSGLAPEATMYEGIERIPGGHALQMDGDSGAAGRTPFAGTSLPKPRAGTPEELADTVWRAVEAAVARATENDESVGVLLSGGLDSGTIATASRAQRPTYAVSARFPDFPQTDESELIQGVRDELGIDGSWVVVRTTSMLHDALDYQRLWQLPSPSPTLMFQLPLARAASATGVSRLLSGEGGDELFGLRSFLLADRLRRGRLLALRRLAGSLGGGLGTVWDYGVKPAAPKAALGARRRRAPAWLRPEHAAAAQRHDGRWDWKKLDGPAWQAQAWDELTVGRQRAEAHQYLRQRAAMAGIDTAHPYLEDLDLIELCVSLPPEPAFTSELDRPYLRAAARGRLPEQVRVRPTRATSTACSAPCSTAPTAARSKRSSAGIPRSARWSHRTS
jgi:asparagine synthase (glutamine-hydrolysing)